MRVTCERCKTEYRFDDSRVTEAGVRVKCTRCDHVFLVRRKSFVVTEAVPVSDEEREALERAAGREGDDPGTEGKHRRWLIRRRDGELLEFKEMTTLQRWIVERRVTREDEISHNGERWKRLGSIPELDSFFLVVEATPHALDDPAEIDDDVDTAESKVVDEPPEPEPPRTAPEPPRVDPGAVTVKESAIGRVETAPHPMTPPPRIEERSPVLNNSSPGSYNFTRNGSAAEESTSEAEPTPPEWASEPTTVGENPAVPSPPRNGRDNLADARDPAWSDVGKKPQRLDEDHDKPRPRRRGRGLRVFLVIVLLIVLGGAVFYIWQPQKAKSLLAEARARVSGLIAQVTFPQEALEAADKGQALLREDAAPAYEEAEAEFRAAMSLVKSRPFPRAAAGLAESLALQDVLEGTDKHRSEVARYAEEALAADPTLSDAYRARAWHALLKKDYDEADAAVVKALARNPRDAAAHTLRATIYMESGGREDEVLDSLQSALSIDPNLPRANYLMAKILVANGQIAEAKPFANRAAAASPRNERAEVLLKEILSGDAVVVTSATPSPEPTAEATATPQRALSVDELVQRGYRAHERGAYAEARKYYERAIDKAPDNSEAYALLGLTCLMQHDLSSAESYLLGARNLNPRYADTYRYLGMLYAQRMDKDRAVENFNKYLGMRPNGSGADDVRRRLAALEGHSE